MKKLTDFIDVIMSGNYKREKWVSIYNEVLAVYANATDEEKEAFEDSGAADMIEMLIEYAQ